MVRNTRVLLVDDDVSVAELTATYLERIHESFETVIETDPAAGLDAVESGDIDCVVSDYDMPTTDGLAFLAAVRESHPNLPFVLFTGKGSEEIASDAISAGVTDYLQKETGTDQYAVLANRVENAVAKHRAERAAAEADARRRRTLDRITDAFYAIDEDWTFTYVNRRAAEIAGYEPAELVGQNIRDVLPDDRAAQFHDAYRQAFERQEPITLETESALEPGMWIEERVFPAEDGLSVYFRDITERKRMELELRDTKAKVEAIHDTTARVVDCSTETEVCELMRDAAEEVLAFDWCVVDLCEGDRLVPYAASRELPADGRPETMHVDGDTVGAKTYRTGESYLLADLDAADLVDGDENAAAYRSAISIPIGDLGVFQAAAAEPDAFDDADLELAELLATAFMQAIARVRSETELRAERDRFAELFENVPHAALRAVFDPVEPAIRNVNPAFEEVFGWSADDFADEVADDMLVPDADRENAARINERARRGDPIVGEEVRRKTTTGVRDFLLHTAPVEVEDHTELFAIYTDITELKRRERKLEDQNDRLEEFASVISHDLRNPLAVACGQHALLEERHEDDDSILDTLGRTLDRMDELTDELLTLARQGRELNDPEPVSLTEVATAAWTTVDTGDADFVLDADLGTVTADPGRLQGLFENLFGNAVEHGASDSPRPDDETAATDPPVTVQVSRLANGAGFAVTDDGPGIPQDQRDRIFEHGYTTAENGTGFGLAIVESVVDAHGWSVELRDGEDGGARFEIHT